MSKKDIVVNDEYGIQYYDNQGMPSSYTRLGNMLFIKNIIIDIEKRYYGYRLKFVNNAGITVEHDISNYDLLGDKNLNKELINKGADILPQHLANFRKAFKSLLDRKYRYLLSYSHTGFHYMNKTDMMQYTDSGCPPCMDIAQPSDEYIPPDDADAPPEMRVVEYEDCIVSKTDCQPTTYEPELPHSDELVAYDDNGSGIYQNSFSYSDVESIFDHQADDSLNCHNEKVLVYRSSELIADGFNTAGNSLYLGNLDLTKHGSYDEWRDMIINDVLPYDNLLLAFLGGASSIISGLIGEEKQFSLPIFNLYGKSGTGKSCTAKVIASIFGRPFDGVVTRDGKRYNSVYGSWTGTENAIRDRCAGNRGTVIILNELGKSKINDMTQLIYDFSEGNSKARSTGSGDVVQNDGFRTSIISVGEFSIFNKCNNLMEGVVNRVMEIEAPFTKDAEHAKRLESNSFAHCGHAADIMAGYIIENMSEADVCNLYDSYLNKMRSYITDKSPAADRFISTFAATIMTTASIASKAWNLDIDLNHIIQLLYDFSTKRSEDADLIKKSFNDLIEYCLRHIDKFYIKPLNIPFTHDRYGFIDYKTTKNKGINHTQKKLIPSKENDNIVAKLRRMNNVDAENDDCDKGTEAKEAANIVDETHLVKEENSVTIETLEVNEADSAADEDCINNSVHMSNVSNSVNIWVIQSVVEKYCEEELNKSVKQCVSEWKERGWVKTEKDRLTYRDNSKIVYYRLTPAEITSFTIIDLVNQRLGQL